MSLGYLVPDPRLRELNDLGLIQAGCLLHTYVSGTPSTPLIAWQDSALTIQHANPIVASAGGLFAMIFLTPGVAYKLVLTDALGNFLWDADPVTIPAAGLSAPVTVVQGGTGIIVGVSGGILYFSSTTTIASSALLAAHGVVIGGGAGVAPLTTGAGVLGQVFTSNGPAADPTFQTAPGIPRLLKAGSGTSASTGANVTLDSVVLPALTNLDQLEIRFGFTCGAGISTAGLTIRHSTDGANLFDCSNGVTENTGEILAGFLELSQDASGNTKINSFGHFSNSAHATNLTTVAQYTATALWGAAWTLALNINGQTSGSTKWWWSVYLRPGQ